MDPGGGGRGYTWETPDQQPLAANITWVFVSHLIFLNRVLMGSCTGVADPNVAGNARQRMDLTSQTLFIAMTPACTGNITASKMPWPIPKVQMPGGGGTKLPIKCLRKGFLMNDDTVVRNVNGQGLAEDGEGFVNDAEPNIYAGLSGGGFFELPGCVTTYAVNGTCGRKANPNYHGEGGDHGPDFVTGAGRGVANVLIENVRLNDILNVTMDPHARAD